MTVSGFGDRARKDAGDASLHFSYHRRAWREPCSEIRLFVALLGYPYWVFLSSSGIGIGRDGDFAIHEFGNRVVGLRQCQIFRMVDG